MTKEEFDSIEYKPFMKLYLYGVEPIVVQSLESSVPDCVLYYDDQEIAHTAHYSVLETSVKLSLKDALEQIVGCCYNPITKRKDSILYESVSVLKTNLDKFKKDRDVKLVSTDIDEAGLDQLARKYCGYPDVWPCQDERGNDKYALMAAYKDGYHKAKEE